MNDTTEVGKAARPHWNLAIRVAESQRRDCLTLHFGRHAVRIEQAIYGWLARLAPAHRGGYWNFYVLPNDGFYMAPDDEPFALHCEGNGFAGTVSAEAAGIIACLMAYSHQSFEIDDPRIPHAYQRLLACVQRHPEARAIFRAID